MKKSAPCDREHLDLFAHILMAQGIWLNRINGIKPDAARFEGLSLDDCGRIFEEDAATWRKFLGGLNESDLEMEIVYKTLGGEEFRSPLKEILIHVANHGTYHRGQIAITLKKKVPGISTDYIFYLREN